MEKRNLPEKLTRIIEEFSRELETIYKDDMVSLILYGSGANGEFMDKHSNLNLLVILKDTKLDKLTPAADLINKPKFRIIQPLFFSKEYIYSSTDVFPIEFLDMRENYKVLKGEDVLKDIVIDTKNLRFQCEHELKAKLINLRQSYLKMNRDKALLKHLLLKFFTSIIHILRNVIRIKGRTPDYSKQNLIKQIAEDFPINTDTWNMILRLKNKEVTPDNEKIKQLFISFAGDLEKIVDIVDKS
ncbi:MAG: hypothetical protein V2A64_07275 [Candidatus Omnitrophota bacterium]